MAPGATGWDLLSLGLGIGSSAAAVAAALWGLWKLGRRLWNHTIGLRRAQAAVLDQLACTVSRAYVESLLGAPRFIPNPHARLEERIYRLPGAWVAIQFKGDAVNLFSITITDADMWYRTTGITLGVIDLKLGYDTFAQASARYDGQQIWIGNRDMDRQPPSRLLPALPPWRGPGRPSALLVVLQRGRCWQVRRCRRPLLVGNLWGPRRYTARPGEDHAQHSDHPVAIR